MFLYGASRHSSLWSYLIVVTNTNESSLRKEGLVLAHSLRMQSTMAGNACSRGVKHLVTWHPQSGGREKDEYWCSAGFLLI